MFKKLLLAIVCTASMVQATEIKYAFVDDAGIAHLVQPYHVDPVLRNIPTNKMHEAMKYIAVRAVQMDNGEYVLHAHVRGLGGGPVLGFYAYCTTKVVGYTAYAGLVVYTWGGALVELPEAIALIEQSAYSAGIVGTALPTP